MNCYKCGCALNEKNFCTGCGADVGAYKRIVSASNALYNDGLEKAQVRDLSGAIISLQQSLKLNNNNVDARNLLGLIYFEMGEAVQALNQWVISKNFRSQKNIADDYINMIQNNPSRLDNINQTVKKYNQALNYCHQDSLDLAVLQLKKVLSLNPKYMQARQLLALIYMNNEDWERARRELLKCQKIDINNTITLRYLKETEKMLAPEEGAVTKERKRDKDKDLSDSLVYQSGNETIIQPSGISSTNTMGRKGSSILNILIGIILGALAVWFLIVPAKDKSNVSDLEAKYKTVCEEKDALVSSLEAAQQRVTALNEDNVALNEQLTSLGGAEGVQRDYDLLLEAMNLYMTNPADAVAVAEVLVQIDETYVGTNATEGYLNSYNHLKDLVGETVSVSYYEAGLGYYNDEYYEEAISVLSKAFYFNEKSEDSLFLMGNCYRMLGNNSMAIETYSRVIELFPDTRIAEQAQGFIDTLSQGQ